MGEQKVNSSFISKLNQESFTKAGLSRFTLYSKDYNISNFERYKEVKDLLAGYVGSAGKTRKEMESFLTVGGMKENQYQKRVNFLNLLFPAQESGQAPAPKAPKAWYEGWV